MRSFCLALGVLALVMGHMACAPQLQGPTAPSGYVFSFHTSDSTIWLEPVNPPPSVFVLPPTFASLTVQVRNTQGQPVDGIPVQFQVDPAWADSATVVPQRTTTHGGHARAVLRAFTTGVIPVEARVENTTHQLGITVRSPYTPREKDSE